MSATSVNLSCTRCKSTRVRRSKPRTLLERWLRNAGGLHFQVCRDCGARTRYWRALGARRLPAARPETVRRHRRHSRRRAAKVRGWIAIAFTILFGATAALGFHDCWNRRPPTIQQEGDY